MSLFDETDAASPVPVRIDVRRGNPTDEELAAIVAVVTEAFAAEQAGAVAAPARRPSGWQLTRRALRTSFDRRGGWGGFRG
ncbi:MULTISPECIES: acyl-CoA carboxylase subunit epsilon [Microbacterium]|uniref:acyl-CoA carboxylase subunit epsilon n=1 Tax=Microbacterium TaxID=33882 RepID=UPI002015E7C0|nr:acyl-CoA carboxylase subunit epsilon [Microbacterium sp. 4NA327F11]MCK9913243.1 acyl-CoA carboxylase subunit epsilon [Microbacteriaceae bacterium K1510]